MVNIPKTLKSLRRFFTISIIFSTLLMTKACYYDVESELFPCQTPTTVTYAQHVAPIINSNCLVCHSDAAGPLVGGNISLEGYNNLKVRVDDTKLLCSIKHQSCASPMPKSASQLNACTISEIEAWINDGAQNN